MKQVISKLKKSYDIVLIQQLALQRGKLVWLNEPKTISKTYIYPSQKYDPLSYIQIPLDIIAPNRKNIMLRYRQKELCHTTKKISYQFTGFYLYQTHNMVTHYKKNFSDRVISNGMDVWYKGLYTPKCDNVHNSKEKQLKSILSKNVEKYDIRTLVCDLFNTGLKDLVNQVYPTVSNVVVVKANIVN